MFRLSYLLFIFKCI